MCVDRIGEIGDWASEGQATRVNGAGFTAVSMARKGARVGCYIYIYMRVEEASKVSSRISSIQKEKCIGNILSSWWGCQ